MVELKSIEERIKNLSDYISTFEENEIQPTEIEFNELESISDCIRQEILHEFRNLTHYNFNDFSTILSMNPVYNKEIMEQYSKTFQKLNTLNDLCIRIRHLFTRRF